MSMKKEGQGFRALAGSLSELWEGEPERMLEWGA